MPFLRFLLLTSLLLVSACSLTNDFGDFEGPGAVKGIDGGGNGGDTRGDDDGGLDASAQNGSNGNTGGTNGANNGSTGSMNSGGDGTGGTTGSMNDMFKLSVSITGPGTISGDFTCASGKCEQMVTAGSKLVLNAVASSQAAFGGWYGPCAEDAADGTVDQISLALKCTLSATSALDVTALFEAQRWFDLTVTHSGSGTGSIKSSDGRINCDGTMMEVCSARYVKGSQVQLSALAGNGATFSGWGGLCTGTMGCNITMTYASVVDAVFDLPQYGSLIVTKSTKGRGLVESSPAGIACGESCSASYALTAMQQVLLAATPEENSIFKGFSGDCQPQQDNNATCLATVDGVKRVNVEFAYKTYALSIAWAGTGAGAITGSVDANSTLSCTKPASCSKSYEYGTTVELTAQPATGSSFVGWSGGGCTGTAKCNVDITKTTLVVANFSINNYALVVGATGDGSVLCGSSACGSQYSYGTSLTFNAVAGAGAELSSWGGACEGTAKTSPCTLTITKDTSVLAAFAKKTYTLTVSVAGTSSGSVAGSLSCSDTTDPCTKAVNDGDNLTLTASAGPGAIFAGWSGACGGNADCNVTNVSGDVNVTATFNTPVAGKKTLVVGKTGKGSIASTPSGISCDASCTGTNASFDANQAVELTATPASGYGAATFTGCDTTNDGKCQIAMNDADDVENVSVSFPPTSYPVNVTLSGNGDGNVTAVGMDCRKAANADCSESRPFDSTYLLTATPAPGSTFGGWGASGPCAGVQTPTCEITVAQTNAVTASFTLKTFAVGWSTTGGFDSSSTVKVTPATGASGGSCAPSASGSCTYNFGTNVTLTAQPGVGSVFVKWTGDAASCGSDINCPINVLSADKTVSAEFATKTYEISVTVSGPGSVKSGEVPTPNINCTAGTCKATYAHGSTAALSALVGTPGPGFANVRFSAWGGDCTGTSASCSLSNISANKSVQATFVNQYKGTLTLAGSGVAEASIDYVTGTGGLVCKGNTDPCEQYFDAGASVTLTATPPSGTRFAGWSGVTCSGTGQSQTTASCTFTMNSSPSVTAAFVRTWGLTVKLAGSGYATGSALVTGAGISCNGNETGCSKSDVDQGSVTLTAAADNTDRRFVNWSGVTCSGGNNGSSCTFNLNQATTVTATFVARFAVSVDLTGYDRDISPSSGQDITNAATFVTNGGGTLNCTGANDPCISTGIDVNTSITLNAANPPGFRFHSWTGVTCNQGSTSSACTFSLDAAKSITARYVRQWSASAVLVGSGVGGRSTLVSAKDSAGNTLFDCLYNGSSCTTTVDEGTALTFSATPPAWASFAGFSGGCVSATTACSFTVSGTTSVNANFSALGALVFVTEKAYLPNISFRDTCTETAKEGGFDLQAAFVPWYSTSGTRGDHAISHYSPEMQEKATLVMVDGTQIASGGIKAILTGGSFVDKHHPISVTQTGRDLAKDPNLGIAVWTGTDASGLATTSNCQNWSSSGEVKAFGTVGNAAGTGSDWTTTGTASGCLNSARIYCFQDPYAAM